MDIKIEIPQHLARKYLEEYDIPDIICKFYVENEQILKEDPVIINAKYVQKLRLEYRK